eukprot:693457-Pleurochrysis_carterae.AAC.1
MSKEAEQAWNGVHLDRGEEEEEEQEESEEDLEGEEGGDEGEDEEQGEEELEEEGEEELEGEEEEDVEEDDDSSLDGDINSDAGSEDGVEDGESSAHAHGVPRGGEGVQGRTDIGREAVAAEKQVENGHDAEVETDSEDEAPINTIGNVPLEWCALLQSSCRAPCRESARARTPWRLRARMPVCAFVCARARALVHLRVYAQACGGQRVLSLHVQQLRTYTCPPVSLRGCARACAGAFLVFKRMCALSPACASRWQFQCILACTTIRADTNDQWEEYVCTSTRNAAWEIEWRRESERRSVRARGGA